MKDGFVNSCFLPVDVFGKYLSDSLVAEPFTLDDMYSIGNMIKELPISHENFNYIVTWPFFEADQRAEMFLPLLFSDDEYHDENAWKRYVILSSSNSDVLGALEYMHTHHMDEDDRKFLISSAATIKDQYGNVLKPSAFEPRSIPDAYTSPTEAKKYQKYIKRILNKIAPLKPYTGPTEAKKYQDLTKKMLEKMTIKSDGEASVEVFEAELPGDLMDWLRKWGAEQGFTVSDNTALKRDVNELNRKVNDIDNDVNIAFNKFDALEEKTKELDDKNKELDKELDAIYNEVDKLLKEEPGVPIKKEPGVTIKKEPGTDVEEKPKETLAEIFQKLNGQVYIDRLIDKNTRYGNGVETTPEMDAQIKDLVKTIEIYHNLDRTSEQIWNFVNNRYEVSLEAERVRKLYKAEELPPGDDRLKEIGRVGDDFLKQISKTDTFFPDSDNEDDFSRYGNVTPNI